jgi:hypothetical protein
MSDSKGERDPIDRLAEEFAGRLRRRPAGRAGPPHAPRVPQHLALPRLGAIQPGACRRIGRDRSAARPPVMLMMLLMFRIVALR